MAANTTLHRTGKHHSLRLDCSYCFQQPMRMKNTCMHCPKGEVGPTEPATGWVQSSSGAGRGREWILGKHPKVPCDHSRPTGGAGPFCSYYIPQVLVLHDALDFKAVGGRKEKKPQGCRQIKFYCQPSRKLRKNK